MTRIFFLGAVLSLASTCSKTTVHPSPVPTVVVPDASVPACLGAYNRMIELHCPPEEDARGGWEAIECPKLSGPQTSCIVAAITCAQTRLCQEPAP